MMTRMPFTDFLMCQTCLYHSLSIFLPRNASNKGVHGAVAVVALILFCSQSCRNPVTPLQKEPFVNTVVSLDSQQAEETTPAGMR